MHAIRLAIEAGSTVQGGLQAADKERNVRENAPPELFAKGMAEVEEEDEDLDDRTVLTGEDLIERYISEGGALGDTVNDFDNWLRGPYCSR